MSLELMLIVISSTDIAAVFSVLRGRNISLSGKIKPLLELESGSNDPTAVFLTAGLVILLTSPKSSGWTLLLIFLRQMGIGALVGYLAGKGGGLLLQRFKLSSDGFYPVFALGLAGLVYGASTLFGGSGFLAVYIAGIVVGNTAFGQKKALLRFFEGLAWLAQIIMFLTLGLFVNLSELLAILPSGLVLSFFLIFIGRPVSVFLSLMPFRFTMREKTFVSWVGLRGAVPVILATFPLIARIDGADRMLNLVFFVVLSSAFIQGWSLPAVAKLLGIGAHKPVNRHPPLDYVPPENSNTVLLDSVILGESALCDKTVASLGFPPGNLILVIVRGDEVIVPRGSTVIREGDVIQVLVTKEHLDFVREILMRAK